jgi:hypothetical protein
MACLHARANLKPFPLASVTPHPLQAREKLYAEMVLECKTLSSKYDIMASKTVPQLEAIFTALDAEQRELRASTPGPEPAAG